MNNASRPWYRMKRTWIGGVVGLAVVGAVVGSGGDEEKTKAAPSESKTVSAPPSPTSADEALEEVQESNKRGQDDLQEQIDEAAESAKAEEPESEPVPNVVGMNHADAMTVLHTAGFMVNEESISPGNTLIINNSNWKVCSQDPAAGTTDVLRVQINSVKLDESC